MKSLTILLVVLLVMSCRPCKEVSRVEYRNDTTVVVRDSTIIVPPDSAWFRAMLSCDSANQVVISELEFHKGKKVSQTVVFRDRYIKVVAGVDSTRMYERWREKYVRNTAGSVEMKTIEKIVYPRWLVAMAVFGVVVLVSWVSVMIVKIKTRVFKPP